MPPDAASDTATDTGEESGVDVDESFPPPASHVLVELQNLWKQIEERGFRIQEDLDQEASGLASIRTASPICIRTGPISTCSASGACNTVKRFLSLVGIPSPCICPTNFP